MTRVLGSSYSDTDCKTVFPTSTVGIAASLNLPTPAHTHVDPGAPNLTEGKCMAEARNASTESIPVRLMVTTMYSPEIHNKSAASTLM